MANVPQKVPGFELKNQSGRSITSDGLLGRWFVLYWYPKADTPGCTAQAQGLQDQLEIFEELNTTVLGASFDDEVELKTFRNKFGLSFDLLSDPQRIAGKAFGVAGNDGQAKHPERVAFLVNPEGLIRQRYEVSAPGNFAFQVLDDLEAEIS